MTYIFHFITKKITDGLVRVSVWQRAYLKMRISQKQDQLGFRLKVIFHVKSTVNKTPLSDFFGILGQPVFPSGEVCTVGCAIFRACQFF